MEFISNSKSGQFFFYSHDGRYMIKTQTTEENKFMKRILPHYYRYVSENPHTFLVRIYGMHRVKMYHLQRKVHFVIMGSVFDTPVPINTIYDLKGSLVGRRASAHDREVGGVLKDNDLVEDGTKLKLGSKRQAFLDQIEKDTHFLAGLNIMDYSLLVGIHSRASREEPQEQLEQEKAGPVVNVDPVSATVHVSHNVRSKTPFRKIDPTPSAKPLGRGHSLSQGDEGEEAVVGLGDIPSLNPANRPRSQSLSGGGMNRRRSTASVGGGTKRANPRRMSAAITAAEQISSSGSQGEYSPTDLMNAPSLSGLSDADITNTTLTAAGSGGIIDRQLSDNASVLSGASDVYTEDEGDLEIEEDDDADCDQGDSDVEFDPEVLAALMSRRGSVYEDEEDGEGTRIATEGGQEDTLVLQKHAVGESAASSVRQDAVDAGDISVALADNSETQESSVAGAGISGEEGRAVRELFNDDQDLARLSLAAEKEMMISSRKLTFGPGAARVHPWTSRADMGINSRLENEMRGDEIYYVGIIDILQQYNASKRAETFFKVSLYKSFLPASADLYSAGIKE